MADYGVPNSAIRSVEKVLKERNINEIDVESQKLLLKELNFDKTNDIDAYEKLCIDEFLKQE
ncbi:MAG: hypothetical protein FWF56_03675 [Firmicutes bacterium]|nr:hypothetical protein [Bacillota bacterium]